MDTASHEPFDLAPYAGASVVDKEGNIWFGDDQGLHRFYRLRSGGGATAAGWGVEPAHPIREGHGRVVQLGGLVAPMLAVRPLSMALPGTDVQQHRHFASANPAADLERPAPSASLPFAL